jgi:hypothetical protein
MGQKSITWPLPHRINSLLILVTLLQNLAAANKKDLDSHRFNFGLTLAG